MMKLSDSTLRAAIVTILLFTAGRLPASMSYDWTATDGGGTGTIVFSGELGATANPATDILSFSFSNDVLSDWSLADLSGSWAIPLSLTQPLTPQSDGTVFSFSRGNSAVGESTLLFYYCAPPTPPEGGGPTPVFEGIVGWSWESTFYPGTDPTSPDEQPEYEEPVPGTIPDETGGTGTTSTVITDAGAGQWLLPGDFDEPEVPAVPVPPSVLLALAGLGVSGVALRRRTTARR